MGQIMNGPVPFLHPFSGRLIGPYEWYEGFAHQEHENEVVAEMLKAETASEQEYDRIKAEAAHEPYEPTADPQSEPVAEPEPTAGEPVTPDASPNQTEPVAEPNQAADDPAASEATGTASRKRKTTE